MKQPKKVLIIGLAESYPPPATKQVGWEWWGCNWAWSRQWPKQCNRWFELHRRKWLKQYYGAKLWKRHIVELAKLDIPVMTLEPWPELPKWELLPDSDLGWYHQGSFDWMVAYALHLKPTQLGFVGIDLRPGNSEPIAARACLEYWIGRAQGQGVTIDPLDVGGIFRTYQYVQSYRRYGLEPCDPIVPIDGKPLTKAERLHVG